MSEEDPNTYVPSWPDSEKLDYVANHLRIQALRLDVIEQMLDRVGQLATNTDAFCTETREAVAAMRKNPLMRGMLPAPAAPGKLIV